MNDPGGEESQGQELLRGIHISSTGEVTIAPELEEVLCDLAIDLQADDDLPVDVEHVVAAIIIGVQQGDIHRVTRITTRDPALRKVLARNVKMLFEKYGGQVSENDDELETEEDDG